LSQQRILTAADWKIYRRLLGYVKPHWYMFLFSVLGFMLFAAMDVLAADIMQYLVDSIGGTVSKEKKLGIVSSILDKVVGLENGNMEQARTLIPLVIFILAVFRGIGSFVGNYCIKFVGNTVVFQLREDLFAQLVELPISFITSKSSGSLVSRLTFNVSQITNAVTTSLVVLFREGMSVIFLFGYLLYINWKLTMIFLIVAPAIGFVVNVVGKRFRRLSHRLQRSMGDVTHIISETVDGCRDMRVYGAQATERGRFTAVNGDSNRQQMKIATTNAAFSPIVLTLLTVAVCILIWLGLSPSVISSMSPGLFVSYLIAAGVISKPIRQLTSIAGITQKALAAAEDIFRQLDEPKERETGSTELQQVQGAIRFEHVTFTYPGQDQPALADISFEVKPGELVALVGASGGGKSTLVSLLPRFSHPDSGEIFLDGIPISSLRLANLRHQIALVSQNVVLMNDTVRNNIAYGELRQKSESEVIRAAQQANAHEFIMAMEQGYNTPIGDNGVRLSGGQRQRISIARAILKNAPILILDEATSALDNESERLIQAALKDVTRNRTTLVIAHRLSTIEMADTILVIDRGRIVEQGNHAELLARNGRYAELYRASHADKAE
jgi:subfamily B ATP-binding cassette protein MsbA